MPIKEIKLTQQVDSASIMNVVRGDNRAHIVRMTLNRTYGGVDLSGLVWFIAVTNANNEMGIYPLQEISIGEETITLDWLVSGVATTAVGKTRFELEGIGKDENGKSVVFQSASRCIKVLEDVNAEPPASEDVLDAFQTALLEAHNAASQAKVFEENAKASSDAAAVDRVEISLMLERVIVLTERSENAADRSEAGQSAAENAQVAAEIAQERAEAAEAGAVNAQNAAETAQTKAETARAGAVTAQQTTEALMNDTKVLHDDTAVIRDDASTIKDQVDELHEDVLSQADDARAAAFIAQQSAMEALASEKQASTYASGAKESAEHAAASENNAAQTLSDLLRMMGSDIATLVNGKIPVSQIPALATTEVYTVESDEARDALTDVQRGDICVVTYGDETKAKSFIYDEGWVYLASPTDYAAKAGYAEMAGAAVDSNMINGHRLVQMKESDFATAVLDEHTYYLVYTDEEATQ